MLQPLDYIWVYSEDWGKTINYLKIDVEGSELTAVPTFFKHINNVYLLEKVDQIHLEIHTQVKEGIFHIESEEGMKELGTFLDAIKRITKDYGFRIIDHAPNPCMHKNVKPNGDRYNTNIDITLYKP